MAEERSLSGLTDEEAKEFHTVFSFSATVFFVVVIIAHVLAYSWRPFWPGPAGWVQSLLDGATNVTSFLV
jgi:light-harvesting complex 1 beta chain